MDTGTRGPLPPEIYRRRRALALGVGALVLVVIVVIAVVVARSGSSNDGNTNAATDTTAEATAPEVKSPVVPPAVNSPAPTPTQTKAVEPPPVLKAGDDCPDSTLAVKGITNQPRYNVGDQPKFTMVVTNIGVVGCKRDVGASVLAAYVYGLDNKRLWSNLDCAPSNETLVKTIEPGTQVTTEVTWTGMGSEPQCPMPRQPIGPTRKPPTMGAITGATPPTIIIRLNAWAARLPVDRSGALYKTGLFAYMQWGDS